LPSKLYRRFTGKKQRFSPKNQKSLSKSNDTSIFFEYRCFYTLGGERKELQSATRRVRWAAERDKVPQIAGKN